VNKLLLLIPLVAIAAISPLFLLEAENNLDVLTLDNSKGKDPVGIKDNVEIIVRDPNGNITYRETVHNKVVTHGENCVAKMIFGDVGGDESGTVVCIGTINAGFNFIGLGEDNTAVADSDTDIINPADEPGLSTPIRGTITWTNSTNGSYSSVLISSTFTNAGSSETIEEVGLFNATSSTTRGMYARALTGSAVVANGADITINWTFETGSAAVP
jgi:hypothetical protein